MTLGGGDSRSLPLQNWFLMSFSVCSHVVYKGCAMLYGNQYIGQWEQEDSETNPKSCISIIIVIVGCVLYTCMCTTNVVLSCNILTIYILFISCTTELNEILKKNCNELST